MQIIDALIPLVVLIAMGYVLKRYRFLTVEFWQGAERLNYWILFPVLLFSSLATVHFNVGQVLPALAVVFTVTLLMSVVLWVLKARVWYACGAIWRLFTESYSLQYLYWFDQYGFDFWRCGDASLCHDYCLCHSFGECTVRTWFFSRAGTVL